MKKYLKFFVLALLVVFVLLLGTYLSAILEAIEEILFYGDFQKFGAIAFWAPIFLGVCYILYTIYEKLDD